MTTRGILAIDPKRDLVRERVLDVPRELAWDVWAIPEYVRDWFTPRPCTVSTCEIDLLADGIFRTIRRSPDGQEFSNVGCYLEIIPLLRLV